MGGFILIVYVFNNWTEWFWGIMATGQESVWDDALSFVCRSSSVVCRSSSVVRRSSSVNSSHIYLLLLNYWAEFNQILQKWCIGGPSRMVLHKSTTVRFGWTNNMAARAYSLFWFGSQKIFSSETSVPNSTKLCRNNVHVRVVLHNIHCLFWLNKQHGRQRLFFI